MAKDSKIEWTQSTWNPWRGCSKVSSGCKNCYAEAMAMRFGWNFNQITECKSTFDYPLKWKEPQTIFTCSISDFFHKGADGLRDRAWQIVRDTPQHTYLILTKRPENITDRLPADWGEHGYPNVWLGVSVEDNIRKHMRIPLLTLVPAAVKFLSIEPLLEEMSLRAMIDLYIYHEHVDAPQCPKCGGEGWIEEGAGRGKCEYCKTHDQELERNAWRMWPGIDWVIVGGESGPHCRPMEESWAKRIVDDCEYLGVPVFFKQWGGHPDKRGGDKAVIYGRLYHQMPSARRMRQMRMF